MVFLGTSTALHEPLHSPLCGCGTVHVPLRGSPTAPRRPW